MIMFGDCGDEIWKYSYAGPSRTRARVVTLALCSLVRLPGRGPLSMDLSTFQLE